MTPREARRRFNSARVVTLATVGHGGRPHLVPVVFTLAHETIYSAVDHKPKRTSSLRRLANVSANPAVSLLADHYDDRAWEDLWWARAEGTARVLSPTVPEAVTAQGLLAERYRQYRERPLDGAVLAVDVTRWSGWAAR